MTELTPFIALMGRHRWWLLAGGVAYIANPPSRQALMP